MPAGVAWSHSAAKRSANRAGSRPRPTVSTLRAPTSAAASMSSRPQSPSGVTKIGSMSRAPTPVPSSRRRTSPGPRRRPRLRVVPHPHQPEPRRPGRRHNLRRLELRQHPRRQRQRPRSAVAAAAAGRIAGDARRAGDHERRRYPAGGNVVLKRFPRDGNQQSPAFVSAVRKAGQLAFGPCTARSPSRTPAPLDPAGVERGTNDAPIALCRTDPGPRGKRADDGACRRAPGRRERG